MGTEDGGACYFQRMSGDENRDRQSKPVLTPACSSFEEERRN